VFALVLIGDSFTEAPIAHEALSRWVMALIVGVKALKKVVATAEELAQSPQVIEPREVSTNPATTVLLRVNV
jgi:hypothetical protein